MSLLTAAAQVRTHRSQNILAPTAPDPVLVSRASHSAREIRRRRLLCRCAIGLSAEKSCLPARTRLPAGVRASTGCLDSYLRMISCRSATAVNGSQLARWLCSLLSVARHLCQGRFAHSCTRPSPTAAVAYVCGEGADVESHLACQACEHSVVDRYTKRQNKRLSNFLLCASFLVPSEL